jgi:hypothetical protein
VPAYVDGMIIEDHFSRLFIKDGQGRFGTRYAHANFLIVLMLLLPMSSAVSQVKSGTVVIIGHSKQKVVIAADSRQVDDDGPGYHDDGCKIIALNDKLIFAAAGKIRADIGETVYWDSAREARTALTDTRRLDGDKPGYFLNRVSAKWGALLGTKIASSIPPTYAHSVSDNLILVDGLLIGIDESRTCISPKKSFVPG